MGYGDDIMITIIPFFVSLMNINYPEECFPHQDSTSGPLVHLERFQMRVWGGRS